MIRETARITRKVQRSQFYETIETVDQLRNLVDMLTRERAKYVEENEHLKATLERLTESRTPAA